MTIAVANDKPHKHGLQQTFNARNEKRMQSHPFQSSIHHGTITIRASPFVRALEVKID